MKEQYSIHSLSLFVGEEEAGEEYSLPPDFAGRLLGSLVWQPLKSLVLGKRAVFHVDLLAHPALSGLDSLSLGSDFSLEDANKNPSTDVSMNFKSLVSSGWSIFCLTCYDRIPYLDAILFGASPPAYTPTIRHLDLAGIDLSYYDNSFQDLGDLYSLDVILPLITSLCLPSINNRLDIVSGPLADILAMSASLLDLTLYFDDNITEKNAEKYLRRSLEAVKRSSLSSLNLFMRDMEKFCIIHLLEICIHFSRIYGLPIVNTIFNQKFYFGGNGISKHGGRS